MSKTMAPARRIVSVDEPGDCSCCSVEGTPAKPVYHANLRDPIDGTVFARLCGSCYTEVEDAIAAAAALDERIGAVA